MILRAETPSIKECLQIYELLRKDLSVEEAQSLLSAHAFRKNVTVIRRDEQVVGVAFAWHITDPHDVEFENAYPGEDPKGKYLYFPYMYVHEDYRGCGVLQELLELSRKNAADVPTRLAYHKRGHLKILRTA